MTTAKKKRPKCKHIPKATKNKATNHEMTEAFLAAREQLAIKGGFQCPKWVLYCRLMLSRGYVVHLYEARKTVSKYVTVSNTETQFKVRFSNHRPIEARELRGDCDYFVGHTNLTVTTTAMAINATMKHFERQGKNASEREKEIEKCAPAPELNLCGGTIAELG